MSFSAQNQADDFIVGTQKSSPPFTDLGEIPEATAFPHFGPAFEGLPSLPALDELKTCRQWVGWNLERRETASGHGWTKPPVNPFNGHGASHSKPNTWSTYERAAQAVELRKLAGVGFVLTEADPFVGIDLDKCRDATTGVIEPWALDILALAETYAEISPSNTGIRLIARGDIPKAVKCDPAHVELYASQRYLTITGRHIEGTPTEIHAAPCTIEALLVRVSQFRPTTEPRAVRPTAPVRSGSGEPSGTDFFRSVNDLALANLDMWVPKLLPGARPTGQQGYRVSSKDLGRDLEEDLSITPQGAVDFGVADMGDAREGRRTPIDLVLEHLGTANATDAALWLCDQLDRDPASLGWQDLEELTRLGKDIAERIEDGDHTVVGSAEGKMEATTGASWDAPDLSVLYQSRRSPPAFDPGWLGPVLGPWATAQARAVCAPVDYVAVSLLALVGGLLGNRRRPIAGAAWSETPALFAALVGDPSSSKSPASSAVMGLADEAERRLASKYANQLADYETRKVVFEVETARWKGQLREALNEPQADTPVPRPAAAIEPVAPLLGRLIVNDATVEKLALIAAGNPGGFLLHRDELSGLLSSFGRYSGGGGPDRAFWLEAYGGRPHTVDRVKHATPIHIPHLSIGVIGAIQPDRLSELLKGVDDGLVARFLWCWPEPIPGFNISRVSVDATATRQAINRITNLIMKTMPAGEPDVPLLVPLTEAALLRLESFGQEMKAREAGASPMMKGALGKARGHALRLSAILTFAQWAAGHGATETPGQIDEKAVATACAMMGTYFLAMAERVFGDASIPEVETNAAVLARYLRKENATTFNARAVRHKIGGLLRVAEDMDAACAELVEAGLIRTVAGPRKAAGRPSKNFTVNPALFRN